MKSSANFFSELFSRALRTFVADEADEEGAAEEADFSDRGTDGRLGRSEKSTPSISAVDSVSAAADDDTLRRGEEEGERPPEDEEDEEGDDDRDGDRLRRLSSIATSLRPSSAAHMPRRFLLLRSPRECFLLAAVESPSFPLSALFSSRLLILRIRSLSSDSTMRRIPSTLNSLPTSAIRESLADFLSSSSAAFSLGSPRNRIPELTDSSDDDDPSSASPDFPSDAALST